MAIYIWMWIWGVDRESFHISSCTVHQRLGGKHNISFIIKHFELFVCISGCFMFFWPDTLESECSTNTPHLIKNNQI